MVQVPNYPTVMPSGPFIRPQQIDVNADMFGGSVGRGLSALGEGVARFGTVLDANKAKLQGEADAAAGNDAFMGAAIELGQREAQFVAAGGVNATAQYPQYLKDVEAIRAKWRETLSTPEAKGLFENDFRARMLSSIDTGSSHASAQHKVYVTEQAQGRIDLVMSDSQTKFGDDNLFAQNQTVLAREIASQAKLNGWSAEQTAAKWVEQSSKAWRARLTGMANADPTRANREFERYKDNMTPDDGLALRNTINDRLISAGIAPLVDQAMNGAGGTAYPVPRNGIVSAISGGGDTSRLSGGAQNLLAGIRARSGVPNINVTSGYRSPAHNIAVGGAKASQHVHGNALDISLVGLTDQQKAQVLEAAIASGARGIGIYKGGRSLHVDVRPGAALWGMSPAGSYKGHGTNLAPAWAQPALSRLFAGGGPRPTGVMGGAAAGVSGAPLYQRVIGAESGGRVGVVSPKGALGLMQVMPDTGRMVAAQLGIPWNPDRMLNDPQYNMLIGTTYLQTLLSRYGGNETLAVAAYNAGPGRVDRWLTTIGDPRSGMMSNEQWASQIPIDETRDYVAKIFGSAGPTPEFAPITGRSSATEIAAARDRIAVGAESIAPGNVSYLNAALTSFEGRVADLQRADAALQEENWQALVGDVIGRETGVPLTSIDQLSDEMKDRLMALPAGGDKSYKSVTDLMRQNSEQDDTKEATPEQVRNWHRLRDMGLFKWEDLRKIDVTTQDLTPTQRDDIVRIQTTKPTAKEATQMLDVGDAMRLAEGSLSVVGLTKEADPGGYETFRGALWYQIERYLDKNDNKNPSDPEIRDMIQTLLTQSGQMAEGWVWDQSGVRVPVWSWLTGATKGATLQMGGGRLFAEDTTQINAIFELEVDVPAKERDQIIAAWKELNGIDPTEHQIQTLYEMGVLAQRQALTEEIERRAK